MGLFYQWGSIIGHDITEGFRFSQAGYIEQGLDLITRDLDSTHDAARAYYGPKAMMPTRAQLLELIANCVVSSSENSSIRFTSRINGNSIQFPPMGYITGASHQAIDEIYVWSTKIDLNNTALSMEATISSASLHATARYVGCGIMAVHS